MRLKPVAVGVSLGIVWGLVLFMTTWLSYLTGYGKLFLDVFAGSIYPGYTISPFGSALVLVYGFVDLFIMGSIFGWIYNRITKE